MRSDVAGIESVTTVGFEASGEGPAATAGAASSAQPASERRAHGEEGEGGACGQAKRRRQIHTARIMAEMSAMRPAGTAWRVRLIPTAPK